MHQGRIYTTIQKSLIRFCIDHGNLHGQEFVNFDAHASINELPAGDLVGIRGLGIAIDEHLLDIQVAIGISLEQDRDMTRHGDAMDPLIAKLIPTSEIKVYDPESGAVINWMIVTADVSVAPVDREDSRTLQFVVVGLATGLTV